MSTDHDENEQGIPYMRPARFWRLNPPPSFEAAEERIALLEERILRTQKKLRGAHPRTFTGYPSYEKWKASATSALEFDQREIDFIKDWIPWRRNLNEQNARLERAEALERERIAQIKASSARKVSMAYERNAQQEALDEDAEQKEAVIAEHRAAALAQAREIRDRFNVRTVQLQPLDTADHMRARQAWLRDVMREVTVANNRLADTCLEAGLSVNSAKRARKPLRDLITDIHRMLEEVNLRLRSEQEE